MILYHGSNVVVGHPQLLPNRRALDFGSGFYTTSDFEQAKKWAEVTAKRRETGTAIVSVYEIDDDAFTQLEILRFNHASQDWLDFVTRNRQSIPLENQADIIIGPVANDNTMPVLRRYFLGIYDAEEALKRLLTQKLKDQIVFKTERALSYIHFKEAK